MNSNNQLIHILRRWYEQKDTAQWVLGVIYDTQGSCYRKAGSMVFFNSLGDQFGLLSGGCLESDIKLNSRKVMDDLQPRCITYDDSDEEDVSFKLGVGCGGTVHLILLPITKQNDYLQLDKVLKTLSSGESCLWQQPITTHSNFTTKVLQSFNSRDFDGKKATLTASSEGTLLTVSMTPPPHLLVVGGGLDAFYLCRLAAQTGWQTSLWDPRPAQGRKSDFPFVDNLLDGPAQALGDFIESNKVDAVMLMSHSKSIDTAALSEVYPFPLKYIGMLGPKHRRDEVIEKAGITDNESKISESNQFIAGPAGLDIGGDLPESIAISIMAQCHGALHNKTAEPLSGRYKSGK